MKSEFLHSGNEKLRIFETVLSSPGMSEKCRILLQLSRQNILILSRIIEFGIGADKKELEGDIIAHLPEDSVEELKRAANEILQKGGLTEFYEKLKSL